MCKGPPCFCSGRSLLEKVKSSLTKANKAPAMHRDNFRLQLHYDTYPRKQVPDLATCINNQSSVINS